MFGVVEAATQTRTIHLAFMPSKYTRTARTCVCKQIDSEDTRSPQDSLTQHAASVRAIFVFHYGTHIKNVTSRRNDDDDDIDQYCWQ